METKFTNFTMKHWSLFSSISKVLYEPFLPQNSYTSDTKKFSLNIFLIFTNSFFLLESIS